jgi:hypothetical protein
MLDDDLPIQTHTLGRVDRGPELVIERTVVVVQVDFPGDPDATATRCALGASCLRFGGHSRRLAFASSAIGDRLEATSR